MLSANDIRGLAVFFVPPLFPFSCHFFNYLSLSAKAIVILFFFCFVWGGIVDRRQYIAMLSDPIKYVSDNVIVRNWFVLPKWRVQIDRLKTKHGGQGKGTVSLVHGLGDEIKKEHILLSIFCIRPDSEVCLPLPFLLPAHMLTLQLTRPTLVTCFFAYMVGVIFSNAMLYTENPKTGATAVVAGIISALVCFPATVFALDVTESDEVAFRCYCA